MSAKEETPCTKRPNYFLWTSLLVGLASVTAVVNPTLLTDTISGASKFFYLKFDWLIMWLPLLAFAVGLSVAFSPRFGNIRLGGKDAVPEYSFLSWMNMLFTAGIGVGIVFFGPIEAMWHYFQSPIGLEAKSLSESQKVENAMSLALHVWGVPAWSLYMIAGLVMAYFTYQHHTECTPAAPLQYAFKHKKWAKPLGVAVTGMAIVSIAISVSSSIAVAAMQISSGLKIITGMAFDNIGWKAAVLTVLALCYTAGAVLPIGKGMKFLGDWTIYLSLVLLAFIFIVGPTHYFLSTIAVAVGNIITQTVHHSFELYMFHNRDWVIWYPMAYWVWWVTWAPFVGVFLAKISRGRTLRQFVLASVMVPAGFIVIWFSVFSGFSLLDTVEGTGHLAEIANKGDYEGTFYYLLNMLPLSGLTKPLTIVMFLGFVVTTVTSAAISLGIMTSKSGRSENKTHALVWCVLMALISYAVIFSGKIEGIKAVGSFAGFPFVFIMYLWFAALWRQLNRDVPRGRKE
ncbi:MAG: BCCT family transporter [Neisseria sp.]|uniref:BCCT family transporter n=1 Tax=Neisseria sp. TaxID=192066 RepID=UPI0026DD3147|nr:BCCT family transporter [Neisseria sp.]MDO4641104.1 BCCT family transporter [Neisseria sp.]